MYPKNSGFFRAMRMYSKFVVLWSAVALVFMSCAQLNSNPQNRWSVRMAESIMARNPNGYGDWDYVTGTVLKSFEELWRTTGDERYLDYIKKTVDLVVNADGLIADYALREYNIDEINEGRALLFLHNQFRDEKYKKAADLLRRQLAEQPRNSHGGFWHKNKYPYQMWLDGLYMGSPFYVEYGKLFNEPENFDDVVKQFVLLESRTRDGKTGLLYHAWDEAKVQEWADAETGLSRIFWGRAMGWYAIALIDVLDILPADYAGRAELIAILQRLMEGVVKVQDESTGVWWQVMDQPGREGNYLEASASCMFTYALAKGVRLAYLDPKYLANARKAYQGILKTFITENADGTTNLTQVCKSAGLGYGRDGSYEYYVYQEPRVDNDGKGLGPFIFASLEMERL